MVERRAPHLCVRINFLLGGEEIPNSHWMVSEWGTALRTRPCGLDAGDGGHSPQGPSCQDRDFRIWPQSEDPPQVVGLGRYWCALPWSYVSLHAHPSAHPRVCCRLHTHPHTHTHTHRCTGISGETWFVTMWRAGQKFWGVKFLFFLSLYSVNGMSVIKNKQIENH